MSDYPVRKTIRLKNFDYSQKGAYFITICTKSRMNMFWVHAAAHIDHQRLLDVPSFYTKAGLVAAAGIRNIPVIYQNILVDKFTVMPNHLHMLIVIQGRNDERVTNSGRPMGAPTISDIINKYKGYVTRQIGMLVWQKSFYEHIIRDEDDYNTVWNYIDQNPINWKKDQFYNE